MAASSSDYFMKTGFSTATTLSSPGYTTGATSINVASTASLPTGTGIYIMIDEVDGNGERVSGTYNVFRGVVSSSTQISSLVYEGGDSNRNYSAGSTTRVYMTISSYHTNRLIDGLLVSHAQDGKLAATGGTLTSPKIITGLNDTNNNELIKVTATASAVNEVTLANAATGNAPQIQASGDDSNIDLRLVPKGTGNVKRGATGGSIDWWEEIGRVTLSGTADTMSLTSLPARKYLRLIVAVISSGAIDAGMTFNNDTSANYAWRRSINGAADVTSAGTTVIPTKPDTSAYDCLAIVDILNISSREKLVWAQSTTENTAGAGNVAGRSELNGKWANTSAQITRVDINNASAGDFAAGSELIVLGHD